MEFVRKITVSVTVTLLLIVGLVFLGREVVRDRIIIEPVAVQMDNPKGALTTELAGQEVLRYFALIQRVGAGEWQQFYIDEPSTSPVAVEQSATLLARPINLKELGAPLNLTTSIGEIASALGVHHPTIKISIGSRKSPPGYISSVNLVGDMGGRATCEVDDTEHASDELVECSALSAMAFIDPKIAAAYVVQSEERNCRNLGMEEHSGATDIAREESRIKKRRDHCSFEKTQALIASILERGRNEDRAWVPYIFGRIHSARADALARIDRAQQLGELDQAIGSFVEALNHRPNSVGPLAVLIDAYVRKGVSMHERTFGLTWSDERTSPLQWHLFLATATFKDAQEKLQEIKGRRSAALDAKINRLEGHLAYRQWLLMAHQRTKSRLIPTAIGQPEELALLSAASERYGLAASKGEDSALFYLEWANILRVMGDFDGAVDKYRRAASQQPKTPGTRLDIAQVYLDKVLYAPKPVDHLYLLIALGASADYLSWASDGGPYASLTSRIADALSRSGHAVDSEAFGKCVPAATAADAQQQPAEAQSARWRLTAELKVCIDQAIEMINNRVIAAERLRAARDEARQP